MGWNYGLSVPSSGWGRLAAVSMIAIPGRLLPSHFARYVEEASAHATGRGRLP
jgi:hypothetical protein